MPEDRHYVDPDPTPMYILLVLAIFACAWFFFVGFTCVRLWFYKGALGPTPEKFLIIPLHRKKKKTQAQPSHALATGVDFHHKRATMFPHIAESSKRKTVFPHIAEHSVESPFANADAGPSSQPYFTTIPAITIEDVDESGVDNFEEFQDPEQVRRYIAEERRISRIPAFEQDDCGDGTLFPDVPYATEPVQDQVLRTDATKTYLEFRMVKTSRMGGWLPIERSRDEMHMAREKLLDKRQSDCVQVMPEGEVACEKVLDDVVQHLCITNPDRFSTPIKFGKKHVRDGAIFKNFSLMRPFECHPLELCARLAGVDFNIFIKDIFTRKWYLQASATLFPAGWNPRIHIGKSLDAIANNPDSPMSLWQNLPTVLNVIQTSPSSLFTRTSTFIQTFPTLPKHPPLPTTLFITRPADLFSGSIANLSPTNLYVRTETQTFRLVPDYAGATVVMATHTAFRPLVSVRDDGEKRELMEEIGRWTDEEKVVKGEGLWGRAVRSWCIGGEAFRDDVTVWEGGDG